MLYFFFTFCNFTRAADEKPGSLIHLRQLGQLVVISNVVVKILEAKCYEVNIVFIYALRLQQYTLYRWQDRTVIRACSRRLAYQQTAAVKKSLRSTWLPVS